ncbi:MAG TPA: type II toxin-antitoxin system VapC family toxin [Candidatus Acidoferrales bacterium]|nr:type II toxin-antitoxin system VapC family toxin [Candidatus Acidoferrales bacterium]
MIDSSLLVILQGEPERRCFLEAIESALGEPLLCKGDDFIHTDVPVL